MKREKKSGPETVMGDVILGMKVKELSVKQEKKGNQRWMRKIMNAIKNLGDRESAEWGQLTLLNGT